MSWTDKMRKEKEKENQVLFKWAAWNAWLPSAHEHLPLSGSSPGKSSWDSLSCTTTKPLDSYKQSNLAKVMSKEGEELGLTTGWSGCKSSVHYTCCVLVWLVPFGEWEHPTPPRDYCSTPKHRQPHPSFLTLDPSFHQQP